MPATAPEEVRGEIAYMNGRAQEAAGNPDAALAAYATVTQRCRFWAQATYLSALIDVERGNPRDAENLLCKVADPKRSATTTPVFADEKFFAVRDLARLGLGRIAHEQGRNDDARYYYYLVPRDSDRLAEALYEAATTRYEKKDYDGARELLDELAGLQLHHRYEDEAWVLDAWVDLARCRFADADKKLVTFLARYEPVRDAARRIAQDDAAMQRLLAAVRSGSDAAGAEVGGASPEVVRTIAALVRVDPAVRSRRASPRRARARGVRAGVRPGRRRATCSALSPRTAACGRAPSWDRTMPARRATPATPSKASSTSSPISRPRTLRPTRSRRSISSSARCRRSSRAGARRAQPAPPETCRRAAISPTCCAATRPGAPTCRRAVAAARKELGDDETLLAKDALHRLDLRLSRLLRRARLGRIESVLGRKRALEVEIEAIRLGYLPQDAVDSLDAARYLEDNEEYWPFEGDDWPDEFVGGETK